MWWRTIVQSEVTFHLEGTLSCLSTTGANQNHFVVFFSSLEMRPRWHFIIFSSPLEGHCISCLNMGASWGVSLPECRSDPWKTRRFLSVNLPPLLGRNVWFQLGSQGWMRVLSHSLHIHSICLSVSRPRPLVLGFEVGTFFPLSSLYILLVCALIPSVHSSWFKLDCGLIVTI